MGNNKLIIFWDMQIELHVVCAIRKGRVEALGSFFGVFGRVTPMADYQETWLKDKDH